MSQTTFEIGLTQERVAIVDYTDYIILNEFKWYAKKHNDRWYAARTSHTNRLTIRMHCQIMGFPQLDIDHVNGNGLDNRRSNLRLATPGQNNANSRPMLGKSSSYKGVAWDSSTNMWMVRVKGKNIGRFRSELDAAIAYDEEAVRIFGKFARPNFTSGVIHE